MTNGEQSVGRLYVDYAILGEKFCDRTKQRLTDVNTSLLTAGIDRHKTAYRLKAKVNEIT